MCTLIAVVLCCDGIGYAFAGGHQHHEHLVRSLVTNRVQPVPTSEPPRIERTCGSPGPRVRRSIGDIRTCVRFGHDGPRTIFAAHLRKRSPQRTCCDVSTPRVKLRTGSIRPLARGCRTVTPIRTWHSPEAALFPPAHVRLRLTGTRAGWTRCRASPESEQSAVERTR